MSASGCEWCEEAASVYSFLGRAGGAEVHAAQSSHAMMISPPGVGLDRRSQDHFSRANITLDFGRRQLTAPAPNFHSPVIYLREKVRTTCAELIVSSLGLRGSLRRIKRRIARNGRDHEFRVSWEC